MEGLNILSHDLSSTLNRRREDDRLFHPAAPKELAQLVDFGSNDTLSLSSSGVLTKAFKAVLNRDPNFMVGSTSTRIFEGTRQYLEDIERDLAKFHNAETGLFFNSGFDANVAVFSTIPQPDDIVVYDEYVHASIHEGMRRGRAKTVSFPHNDCYAFRSCLERLRFSDRGVADGKKVIFIAIESIYSMDGDVAPVKGLLQIARECLPHGNYVFSMDEAHSNGLVGPNGSGFASYHGLEREFGLRLHTCGKALGSSGAIVLCNQAIKDTLINYAKNVIFSTSPSFVTVAAAQAGYELVAGAEGEKRRSRLQDNIQQFYEQLFGHPAWEESRQQKVISSPTENTWKTRPFHSPIIPLVTPPREASQLAKHMYDSKLWVNPVRYPIVPKALERVRISMHADQSSQDITKAVKVIMDWATRRMKRGFK